MKRVAFFLLLAACLSFTALAAPVRIDGVVNVRKEYHDTLATLQVPQHESNNNLSFAYLHWACSPADYSVYLGLQYYCTDHALEDGLTGVEVRINDMLIGTAYADGTFEQLDRDRFEMESAFIVSGGPPYEVSCEIRVGIKFWPDGEIVAGVRILDFGGNPSNYYKQLVYSPFTTTTLPEESTTSPKTTTEKSTTIKAAPTGASTTAAAETTARPARTTAPVITASPAREAVGTTAVRSTSQPTAAPPETDGETKAAKSKTEKRKTTKAETTKAAASKRAEAADPYTTGPATEPPVIVVLPPEPDTTAAAATAAQTADTKMYSELNKVKIIGTVLVVVILTAAVMASVFLGMRQRQETAETCIPPEDDDDF